MTALFPALRRLLRQSIMLRLGLALGTLAVLSFVSIIITTVIADNGSGRASAINLSGSMRMMSFRMLSEVLQPPLRGNVPQTVESFERRVQALQRFVEQKAADNEALAESTALVVSQWEANIRPLVRAAATGDAGALGQLAADMPPFVAQIDRIVIQIEVDLERKITLLRVTQFVLLGVIVLITLVTMWMLRCLLFRPLGDLLKAANEVSAGSFRSRVEHTKEDELGHLGQAFNTMLDEIGHIHAHLEDKVEEKTRALTRSNQSLELLYRTSQQLSGSDLSLERIQAVLRDLERELDLGHSTLCVSEDGSFPAQPLIGDLTPDEREMLCGQRDCRQCFAGHAAEASPVPAVFVPLEGLEPLRGTLPILLKEGRAPTPETARVLQTVGHHVANALSSMRRTEEKHRLAVLEERSVIARELHDSIAQSLSYLKIQVARLEKSLERPDEALPVVRELKSGLNAAYRELRELITTFRLRIDERGFQVALQETLAEFSHKLGFAVTADNGLAGIALSGNEEMHVIRIIREALSNIEKHAQASAARIVIGFEAAGNRVFVRIEDDGQGFDPASIPAEHYGISIIRGRAQSLAGQIEIDSRPGAGTVVTLSFQPQNYRSAPAGAPQDA